MHPAQSNKPGSVPSPIIPTAQAVPTKKKTRRKTVYIFPTYSPTIRALEQRIRRALKHRGETLRRTTGERQQIDLGYYFIIDTQRIAVSAPLQFGGAGRDLGVAA